jgi:hypothetical protein
MTVTRIFGLLIKLYPPDHRAIFGEEMLAVLDQAATRQKGFSRSIGFFAVEATGLLWDAARAWAALLKTGRHPLEEEALVRDGLPEGVQLAQIRVDAAIREMVRAISSRQFERARQWSDVERRERGRLRRIRGESGLGD